MNINKIRLIDKKLYLIVGSDAFVSEETFLDAVAASLKGGVQMLQLREKNSSAAKIIRLGRRIRELCSIYGALFILNDRVDISKVVEADGVHLGQEDVDIYTARDILGSSAIVGISAYNPEQAIKAQSAGADYICVRAEKQVLEFDFVNWAKENVEIPFYVNGGNDLEAVQEVLNFGAKRIELLGMIINSQSPEVLAKSVLAKLK